MHSKANDIARKIVIKSRDIQAVALFNSAHKLIAYATPPGMHDIEDFRTKAKKRIVIMLFMLLFVFFMNSLILYAVALTYVGGNTCFGWDKFHGYCQSTFAFNIGVTIIAYAISLYYAFLLPVTNLVVDNIVVSQYIHVTPLIFLLLFTSVFLGYVLSKKYIGYIDTLSPEELETITLASIATNHDVEKYVLTEDGEYNRLLIKDKNNSSAKTKQKRVFIKSPLNIGKLQK